MCEQTGATMPQMLSLFCRIRPARIGWLRHILEGYDGLALLSTLSAAEGLVRIQTPSCSYFALLNLLEALAPELTPFSSTVQS